MADTQQNQNIELAIIGSGPAGLTAGIYTARAGVKPVIFTGTNIGGQLMQTTEVENYPGFEKGVMGPQLMQNMLKQAENVGAQIVYETIDRVDFSKKGEFKLWVGEKEYSAKAVIIATGANPRKLGLDNEQKLTGRGVSYCATCDGAFFKEKIVAVIGGGNVAFEDALYLTHHAKKVYLVHRREEFRAEKVMIDRLKGKENVEFLLNYEVEAILGEDRVTGLKLKPGAGKTKVEPREVQVDGVFIAIGYVPKTEVFQGQVELEEQGYIVKKEHSSTNIEGVFVAGDAEDFHYRQAITAAGDGCRAALDTLSWLDDKA